jgi:hypothetical protein
MGQLISLHENAVFENCFTPFGNDLCVTQVQSPEIPRIRIYHPRRLSQPQSGQKSPGPDGQIVYIEKCNLI